MIAEALQALTALVAKSLAPVKLPTADPGTDRYVIHGGFVEVPVPTPPRAHEAGNLADLIALANRFAAGGDAPAVFYDESAVRLVVDDGGRRHSVVTMPLRTSDAFAVLKRVAHDKAKFEHKDFVRFLRIDLAGCLDPVVLLNPVRKVRFENGVTVKSDVQRQRESLGREINSRVDADVELPETVTLMVPVYKTLGEGERWPVRCSVEVDPAQGYFRLLPLPDELEAAGYSALGSVADRLAEHLDKSVPAYHGKP